jgi:hypothetical protein
MRERFGARRLTAVAAALALMGALSACGGGSSGGGGGNTPSTLPPAPVRTQIGSQGFTVLGTVDANRAGFERDEVIAPLTISQAGTLEIVADWTFASNDVDIHLYSGTCTFQQLTTSGCSIIARADSVSNKPERLTVAIQPGNYSVGIANFGRTNESGVMQAFLTR